MKKIRLMLIAAIVLGLGLAAAAQMTPWLQWTFLPQARMDEIVGEASGEAAFNSVMAMCGFPRDRKPDEYAGTFREAQFVLDKLKEYGFADAAILRFPGGETWDGVKGELWEVKPGRQKIASYTDLTAMLAQGSASADVTAELVWVGDGEAKDLAAVEVKDKIVVTSGSAGAVHTAACIGKGAAGVISFASPRPLFDPLLIPWGGIGGRGGSGGRRPSSPSVCRRARGCSFATGCGAARRSPSGPWSKPRPRRPSCRTSRRPSRAPTRRPRK